MNKILVSIVCSLILLFIPVPAFGYTEDEINFLNTYVYPTQTFGMETYSPFNGYFKSISDIFEPSTGGLIVKQTDLTIPGKHGLNFVLSRTYMSRNAASGNVCYTQYLKDPCACGVSCDYTNGCPANRLTLSDTSFYKKFFGLGYGWVFDFPAIQMIKGTDGNIELYIHVNGQTKNYSQDGSTLTPGPDEVLLDYTFATDTSFTNTTRTGLPSMISAYLLTYKDGARYYFSMGGHLIAIKNKYNDLMEFYYEQADSSENIWAQSGDIYQVYYNSCTNRIKKVYDTAGREISFTYNSNIITVTYQGKIITYELTADLKSLSKVTDPEGRQTTFSYTPHEGVICQNPDKPDLSVTQTYYDLTTLTYHTGASIAYTYESHKTIFGDYVSSYMYYYRLLSRTENGPLSGKTITTNYTYSTMDFNGYEPTPTPTPTPTPLDPTPTPSFSPPPEYTYWSKACVDNKISKEYTFNQDALNITTKTTSSGISLNTVEERVFDPEGKQLLAIKLIKYDGLVEINRKTTCYVFDPYNNLLFESVSGTGVEERYHKFTYDAAKYHALTGSLEGTDPLLEHKIIFTLNSYGDATQKDDKSLDYTPISPTYFMTDSGGCGPESSGGGIYITPPTTSCKVNVGGSAPLYSGCGISVYYRELGSSELLFLGSESCTGPGSFSETYTIPSTTEKKRYAIHISTGCGPGASTSFSIECLMDQQSTETVKGKNYFYYDTYKCLTKKHVWQGNTHDTNFGLNDGCHVTEFQYDTNKININQITSYEELDGNNLGVKTAVTTQMTYDAHGRLLTATDPKGVVTITTYDDADRVTQITKTKGSTLARTDLAYNDASVEQNGVPPFGVKMRVYETPGTIQDTKDYITYAEFDDFGRLKEVKKNLNGTPVRMVTYTYDKYDHKTNILDAQSNSTTLEYNDPFNRLTKINYPITGEYEEVIYDDINLKRTVRNSKHVNNPLVQNDEVTTVYNVFGEEIELWQQPLTGGPDTYKTKLTYNLKSQKLTVEDPKLNKSYFTYNALGQMTRMKDPNNGIYDYEYDYLGNVKRQIDPRYKITDFVANGMGKTLKSTDPYNKSTYYTYDAMGNLRYVKDARGNITEYQYDDLNRLLKAIDANGKEIIYTYDTFGNKKTEKDPLLHLVEYFYDTMGRQIGVKDAKGNLNGTGLHTTTYTYDNNGNLDTVRNALDYITDYDYDTRNRLTRVTLPNNDYTQYQYDVAGNLTKTIYPNSRYTTYEYDNMNRLTKVTDPRSNYQQFTYDGNNNIATKQDKNGVILTYTYNSRNLPTEVKRGANSLVIYDYDAAGNRTLMCGNGYNYTYAYDDVNRLTGMTNTMDGKTVSYTYDDVGNRVSMTDQQGVITNYEYDAVNRLWKIYENAATTVEKDPAKIAASYLYFDDGTRQRLTYNKTGYYTTYGYDNNHNLTGLTNYTNLGATLSSYTYDYDELNRVWHKTDSRGTTTYGYNNIGQLQQVQDPFKGTYEYSYDDVGNCEEVKLNSQTVIDYVYNDEDTRLMSVTENSVTTSFTYDNNGNLDTKTNNQGTWDYNYDDFNQLTGVTGPGGLNVQFTYDGDGRRLTKTVSSVTTKFLYDGSRPIYELDSGGAVVSSNLYGINLVSRKDNAGVAAYYFYNGHGDTTELVKQDGTLIASYKYDAFGNLINASGDKVQQ
ncbi:MAG: hypothetical protein ACM3WV_05985, partial [Bacillota bacterium]